jgi:hypothetical protein
MFGRAAAVSSCSSWSAKVSASGMTARRRLIDEERQHQRRGRLAGEDHLPGRRRGTPFGNLLSRCPEERLLLGLRAASSGVAQTTRRAARLAG